MATQVITGLLGQAADTAKMRKLTGDSGLGESDMKASVAALEYIISSAARLASPPFFLLNGGTGFRGHLTEPWKIHSWTLNPQPWPLNTEPSTLKSQPYNRFDCDEGTLENELQQLGLPKEHTVSLCRAFKDKRETLKSYMESRWHFLCSSRPISNPTFVPSFAPPPMRCLALDCHCLDHSAHSCTYLGPCGRSLRVSRLGGVAWRVDHNLCSSSYQEMKSNSGQLTLEVLQPSVDGPDGGSTKERVSLHLTEDKLRVLLHELEAARDVMKGVE
jgi:hypothetical protein